MRRKQAIPSEFSSQTQPDSWRWLDLSITPTAEKRGSRPRNPQERKNRTVWPAPADDSNQIAQDCGTEGRRRHRFSMQRHGGLMHNRGFLTPVCGQARLPGRVCLFSCPRCGPWRGLASTPPRTPPVRGALPSGQGDAMNQVGASIRPRSQPSFQQRGRRASPRRSSVAIARQLVDRGEFREKSRGAGRPENCQLPRRPGDDEEPCRTESSTWSDGRTASHSSMTRHPRRPSRFQWIENRPGCGLLYPLVEMSGRLS